MARLLKFNCSLLALSLMTALGLAACVLSPKADAGAYTYGTGAQRTVNAGVLLLNGNVYPTTPVGEGADNKDPYLFYILNQRIDIRPVGWNIVNPNAPRTVTSDVLLRWNARTGAVPYQLGQSVTPAMAAYWEVPLESTSATNLDQYDVLFLSMQQGVVFTAADSEKLRQFVDGGGTLWIEDDGTGTDTVSNLFVNLTFNSGGGTGYASVPSVNRSPLVTTPYALSAQDLNSLGDKKIATFYASNGSAAVPQDSAGHLILGTVIGNSANSGLPAVAAGALGAGQVVVSTVGSADNINGYVSGDPASAVDANAPNSGPYCGTNVQNAPTADLKLLTNIIASSSTHQSEHQNSRQTGVDPGSLPSAVRTWSAAIAGSSTGSAATYGHYAYVVDDTGVLRCYDLYPGEDLDGDGNPDDGIQDYSEGYPFDEVWTSSGLGTYASAPTVAVDNSTTPPTAYVLVEEKDGTVMEYRAVPTTTGGLLATTSPGAKLSGSGGAAASYGSSTDLTGPAPAPTYYNGKVYAGDGDSNLYISTLAASNAGTKISVDSSAVAGEMPVESIVAPPSVGIVPDGSGGNDIVAMCTTNRGLYSVFLGSRGELLLETPANSGMYNSKLAQMNTVAQMDTTAATAGGVLRAYTLDTLGDPMVVANPMPNAVTPNFTSTIGTPLYADYDANIANTVSTAGAATPGPLTRTSVNGTSSNNPAITTFYAYVSAPALDRLGNAYYTVTDPTNNDSVLFSVHDGPKANQAVINWRFRLPATTDGAVVDADNTPYANLAGFQFVTKLPPGAAVGTQVTLPSAPVVDAQGNVYVLATSATTGTGAVLCFNSQGVVSADVLASGDTSGLSSVSISQPINGASDEFGANSAESLVGTQYTVSGGSIDFTNFGTESPGTAGTAGTHVLNPNLNEPYPVTISYSLGAGANATPQSAAVRPLHTNLAWYTVLTSTTTTGVTNTTTTILPTSGLTEVGSKLYFMDSNGLLDTVIADPQAEGITLVNKVISPTTTGTSGAPMFTQGTTSSGVGATAAVPSSAGGAMLVTGPSGTAAYTNQITLVVDANRVMEIDAAGNAQWAVDSTSKTSTAGSTQPVTAGQTTASQLATTTLELNRPSSVYELAQNDYLVADTGNNRCVRFDRAGKVIWELTQFTDPNNLMTAGESATLNQPTSVQVTSSTDTNGNTTLHYLVSDTGNDRIVEVDDVYNAQYVLTSYHVLAWISHTQDVQSRDYRYQSAAYYYNGNTQKTYVIAIVTNKRIAPLTAAGTLSPANQDTQGGSIVLLNYIPGAPSTSTTNGYVSALINSFTANIDTYGKAFPQDGTNVSLFLRNPRYLKAFLPQGASATAPQSFLLADDNGAWAISPNAAGTAYSASFGFTQADYQAMTVPTTTSTTTTATLNRANLPFIPASIQLLGTDVSGGTVYGRFLITNSFSQGEAANDATKIGGEVFEIDQLVTSPTGTTQVGSVAAQTGGYAGHTLSRPTNTSPISQPTFGFRLQF